MNAEQVIRNDLGLIVENLADEFSAMSGRNFLIAGGAGFLGYYLVQSVLQWNRRNRDAPEVNVTVLDNFVRGVPEWLTTLQKGDRLRLLKHDITRPLPADLGSQHFLVHA